MQLNFPRVKIKGRSKQILEWPVETSKYFVVYEVKDF